MLCAKDTGRMNAEGGEGGGDAAGGGGAVWNIAKPRPNQAKEARGNLRNFSSFCKAKKFKV